MRPIVCQCCGLRFSPQARGTNRDGSKSLDYCVSCYKDGEFRDHQITIQEMEKKLLVMAKRHDDITFEEAQETIRTLPDLKRWKMTHIL